MIIRTAFFLIFMLVMVSCTRYGKLHYVAKLSSGLKENSGLAMAGKSGHLWMIEDSGNKSKLFLLDTLGNVVSDIRFKQIKNEDWEDLTTDSQGNVYIGDFGNNNYKRKNLVIYRINDPLTHGKNSTVEEINYYYTAPDHFADSTKVLFNTEAMFYYKDFLYLFTKSRSKKKPGRTHMYAVPAIGGNYEALYLGSFKGCKKPQCVVTAAAISSSGRQMALLTHRSIWLFSDYETNCFFNGTAKEYRFDHHSQKEALCFKNKSSVYLSDERAKQEGGNLYRFDFQ